MNSHDARHSNRVGKPASAWSRLRTWMLAFGGVIVLATGAIVAFEVSACGCASAFRSACAAVAGYA
jgi:hypothetical protein